MANVTLACLLGLPGWVSPAEAAEVFAQRDNFLRGAVTSDRDFGSGGVQAADDFVLSQAATIRSVEWRGWYFGAGTIEAPLSFDLIFYGDDAGNNRPDLGNVLSQTTVVFTTVNSAVLTGRQSFGSNNGPEFGFEADVTPTPLGAGTTYWLSVLANTASDTDDSFLWTQNQNGFVGEAAAARTNIAPQTTFVPNLNGPLYFALDDAALVPEPATGVALAVSLFAAGTALGRRRR